MHTLIATFERISRFAVGASFLVLMIAVLIQVLGRSVFSDSPVWTEELTRFALLFLAAFGAGLSYHNGELVNVTLVCDALPKPLQKLLRLFTTIVTAGLCMLLIMPAWKFTSIGSMQTSPALGWHMNFIHVTVLILLSSLMLFSVFAIAKIFIQTDEPHKQERES